MLRKLFRITWLLAIFATWLTLVVMWVRSERTLDEWSSVDGHNTLRAAVSFNGAVHLIRAKNNASPREWAWDTMGVKPNATHEQLHRDRALAWHYAGFAHYAAAAAPVAPRLRLVAGAAPAATSSNGGGTGRGAPALKIAPLPTSAALAPWLLTYPYDAWVVPYWPAVLVLSVPLAAALSRAARGWHRRWHGRCAGCGYDLRESPGRCPECGRSSRPIKMSSPTPQQPIPR